MDVLGTQGGIGLGMIGPVAFSAPWLLLGLLALPVLYFLLRAIPPAPIKRLFPGVVLLLGLKDAEQENDKTPWWLMVLRMLAVAAAIVGFSGPVLNPDKSTSGNGPLLVIVDGSWAQANQWSTVQDTLTQTLGTAGRDGRQVALLNLSAPAAPIFQTADSLLPVASGMSAAAWEPAADLPDLPDGRFDTLWIADGLQRDGQTALIDALEERGAVTVRQSGTPVFGLSAPRFDDGAIRITAQRSHGEVETTRQIAAVGPDPAGIERQLATLSVTFETGAQQAEGAFDLPPELRNRITRFELLPGNTAGTVALADDSLKRREIALFGSAPNREGLRLLAPLHYLRQALSPYADLIEYDLAEAITAGPDVIILADVGRLTAIEQTLVTDWVEQGGLLIRFAGPRLAATEWPLDQLDPLMPVELRTGGRTLGGTLSWGEPKRLAEFAPDSPFYGLTLRDDVTVSAQVIAQPAPDLNDRVIAELQDGTPLVTRKALGDGQVVLFHVTANAEWSTLPLSGLFVSMLERLSVATRDRTLTEADMAGTSWTPAAYLSANGVLNVVDTEPAVDGADLLTGASAATPPGIYVDDNRSIAVNAVSQDRQLAAATWPESVTVITGANLPAVALAGWLFLVALALLAADAIATLRLSGRLQAAVVILALFILPHEGAAQDEDFAIAATRDVVLAYVITGDVRVDDTSYAGLFGLSDTLWRRSSIEPSTPMGINLDTDELSFFPFIYWPITADQPIPSPEAYEKLNRYLRTGGMILFDTRDADLTVAGSSPEQRRLQTIALGLDIPPLDLIPEDHVLTRAFYLLQDFPGRYASYDVWVEATADANDADEGLPFRQLNDGVTPVVVGGNDWAAAWAIDENGNRLFPVGRGMAGERQREIAYRFGVNLIMHVLTGNYKSDQVHVPALLDRLGQ